MKIIEMAKKAKEFVTEKIRKPKYKKGGLTECTENEGTFEKGELIIPISKNINFITDMTAQNGQEDGKQEQARKYSHEDTKRQETPEMNATVPENMSMTEAQIRKEQLWRHYYEEKAKMSNNKRRIRRIPMVRRPKRQQYRVRKKKE